MGTDIGAKIGIDGEAAFRSSLAAINSQLKNLGSEMKSVVSAFSGMENSEGAVTAKGDVLKRSLNASAEKMKLLQNQSERAKARLATLSDELEKSKQKFGENSEEARKAQDAYNRQVKTVNDLQTQMNRTTTEMNRMKQEMQELGNSSDALSKDLDKTEKSSARLKAAMKAAVSAAAAAVGTLSGLGIAAIKVGSDFEESMSQVAATMGMSVSEIHNGSEAYETLATAAKNAGATTKFTATQAAEALNYLALAGYDAGTSAEVLPSVLNLAAAGGLDLAYASDLATDAMAALGIEASADNLTQFGDQMAMASSKANYSVAQLGEAILTVGGTAKNLAGGTVELNTALGVLANRGIKGAEGGTALRNMILSLSAPTDKAAATLKSLGVSAFDAEGNLNPLNETFKKMDAAMQSMSQEQKTNVLNNIFNKIDLKSAEAMLAGCGAEFDNLSASIANSSGAMQDMADVQMDNLKGQMTILGSGLEGLGIQVYEKFETPMKEAAETAITSVDEVARNLRSGKLSESVDNLAESTGHFMEETTALAVKALPKAINALAAMLRHTKEIKNVTLTAAAAIGTFKAVQSLSTVVKSWQAAEKAVRVYTAALAVNRNAELLLTSTLSAKELVVGVVTGKIALMTAAQTAYNAVVAACPLGLLIAGAAALTIGLVSLLSATEEESEGMREFRKCLEETTDSINQQAEARKSMKETAQESINQSLSEMDYTDSLIRQLQELCDANGQVKDGYENRAKALAEQINSVIPNAISLTEKEGQAYVQTADNLDLLMEKKRVNALLNAKEEAYTAAIQNQAEAMQNLITLEDDIATKKQELIEKEKELQDALMNGSTGQQTKAMSALQQVKDDLAEMEGLYTEQTDILRSSYQDIDEYNSLLALSQSNSLEEIKNGLNEYVYQQQRVTDETKDQLDQQLEVTSRNFATRLKMAQDAGYDIGQAELDALMSTKDDFLNAVQAYADAGREVPKVLKAGIDENAVLYANALVTMKDKGLIEMKKAESEMESVMESVAENCTKGFANGLLSEGAINKVVAAAIKLGSPAVSTLKKLFGIHSPSRVMRDEVGKQIPAGVAVGIEDGTGEAVEAAEKMAEDIAEAAAGMDSMVAFAQQTARKVGDVLKSELEKTNSEIEALQKKSEEKKAAEELKEYKSNLAKKRAELKKAEKKNRQKIQEEIAKLENDWNKKQEDAAKTAEEKKLKERLSALQTFQKEYESALSKIESKQTSLQEKLADYGSLFERVKTEDDKEIFRLGDLDVEIRKIQKYSNAIEEMQAKGLSGGLMSEISAMSVDDALDYMDKLSRMSDVKLQEYIQKYEEKQQLAADAAKKFYQSEFDALEQNYTEKLPQTLGEVKDELYQAGTEAAKSFAQGMAAGSKTDIAGAVSGAVATANQNTQGITMKQIVASLQAQEPVLTEYVQALEMRLVEVMTGFRVEYVNIGEMMMAGLADGIENGRSGVIRRRLNWTFIRPLRFLKASASIPWRATKSASKIK
jgi:TP901 family phage tail tape measure protein